ncbi:MAG: hypothetical protein AB1782_11340, partial [Cyanobacteriota bacterium]
NGNGNSLSQYTNVIVLIALALIPVFYICGQLLIKNFSNFSSGLTPKNVSTNSTANNSGTVLTIKPNDLNGTPDKPVSKCSGGKCSIDYGSFVLNGIPQNFNEFVQTGGTSGGLDELASMLMQIAEQYKEIGDTEGYEDFKKFANLVHIQADMVRFAEDAIKSGASSRDDFETFFKQPSTNYKVPDELSKTISDLLYTQNSPFDWFFRNNCLIDSARFDIKNNSNLSDIAPKLPYNANNNIAYAIVDIFDSIQNKTNKYPEGLRNLTQELYLNINDLTHSSTHQFYYSTSTSNDLFQVPVIDPITGEFTSETESYSKTTDFNELLHPQYSLNEDITGSIICTAGKNTAEARSCH